MIPALAFLYHIGGESTVDKNFDGIPLSNSVKLHDEIGNLQENPLSISKSLFENADGYFKASKIIMRYDHFLAPVIFTNMAFSCELFLKSILFQFKEDNKRIKEHRLYELYKLIPPEQQNEIRMCYEEFPETKTDFKFLFEEVSETFVFARYIHERKGSCLAYELFYLVFAVRDSAKKLYNIQISEQNRLELEKFEKRKSGNMEPSLKFWIYYNENCNCDVEEAAKMLADNLCTSLRSDFDYYALYDIDEKFYGGPFIMLNFTRLGYIYNDEYGNVMMTSLKVLKRFGISYKGLRTNGYQINLQKEIQ